MNCVTDGCARQAKSRGYCSTHYSAALSKGVITRHPDRKCRVSDCHGKHTARGLCSWHYQRAMYPQRFNLTVAQVTSYGWRNW